MADPNPLGGKPLTRGDIERLHHEGILDGESFRAENRIVGGRLVYLEHAPVDPRSLMQGDYMILNYGINRDKALRSALENHPSRGRIVLKLDDRKIATFARFDGGTPLAGDEVRLRYLRRKWRITTAPESFFFQEGHAERYEKAKFSELRVSPDGVAILVALADKDLVTIGEPE